MFCHVLLEVLCMCHHSAMIAFQGFYAGSTSHWVKAGVCWIWYNSYKYQSGIELLTCDFLWCAWSNFELLRCLLGVPVSVCLFLHFNLSLFSSLSAQVCVFSLWARMDGIFDWMESPLFIHLSRWRVCLLNWYGAVYVCVCVTIGNSVYVCAWESVIDMRLVWILTFA